MSISITAPAMGQTVSSSFTSRGFADPTDTQVNGILQRMGETYPTGGVTGNVGEDTDWSLPISSAPTGNWTLVVTSVDDPSSKGMVNITVQ